MIPPATDGFDQVIARLRAAPAPLGLAVSGGSDSIALMHLAAQAGIAAHVVTIDHGLRATSRAEAEMVARAAAALGFSHDILTWGAWDGQGNMQDAARRARQHLIADWAQGRGITAIALGHTRDDQAETVLMRLARAGGVDGLSAMAAERAAMGVTWLRPMLDCPRADLRAYLTGLGGDWVDDPSNDDTRFERVRMRQALAGLADLGITADALARVAQNQQMARKALNVACHDLAKRAVRQVAGDIHIERAVFWAAPAEIRRRLALAALRWVASAEYGPRADALAGMLMRLDTTGRAVLAGCALRTTADEIVFHREFNAVAQKCAHIGAIWDQRWVAIAPIDQRLDPGALHIAALGAAGLSVLPDWRGCARARPALMADPGIWRGPELIAAPTAGWANDWQIRLARGQDDFISWLLSH